MENFHIRLKNLRGDLSQQQAASKVGIKQQNWARYEKGTVLPGAETIHQICVAFGVSADWLLGLPERGRSADGAADALKVAALKGAIQAILDKF